MSYSDQEEVDHSVFSYKEADTDRERWRDRKQAVGLGGNEREEVPSNFCLYTTFLTFLIVADWHEFWWGDEVDADT